MSKSSFSAAVQKILDLYSAPSSDEFFIAAAHIIAQHSGVIHCYLRYNNTFFPDNPCFNETLLLLKPGETLNQNGLFWKRINSAASENISIIIASEKKISSEISEKIQDLISVISFSCANYHRHVDLRERIKELSCLVELSRIASRPDIKPEQIFKETVKILPPALKFSTHAGARICYLSDEYRAGCNGKYSCELVSDILVDNQKRGSIQVYYCEDSALKTELMFLEEEQRLIDTLARQLAIIVKRKEAEEKNMELMLQLRHSDRLATIGQLAAGVAHELNEPLSSILGFAQLIQKNTCFDQQTASDLQKIISASLYAREVVKKLVLFSRQKTPLKTTFNLNTLIEDALFFFHAQCQKHEINLCCNYFPDDVTVCADANQIQQVLINLVVNSIHAMPRGGMLTISTKSEKFHAIFSVKDTGTGMNEDILKQIFVPFFTTKDVNEGTGLGLSVVHGIVSAHRGTIQVKSEPDKGSEFIISLPFYEEEYHEK